MTFWKVKECLSPKDKKERRGGEGGKKGSKQASCKNKRREKTLCLWRRQRDLQEA